MPAYRPVDPRQSFPELEERILERWREHDVSNARSPQREGAPVWSFYEGPPTANGSPGSHHVLLARLQGHLPALQDDARLPRAAQGRLGLPRPAGRAGGRARARASTPRREIEAYGIAEFNQRCRESVFRYIEEWKRMTERIGFWIDLEDAYRRSPEYIESVWWSLREMWDEAASTRATRSSPTARAAAPRLSSHETAMGYEDVEDLSVYVRLPVIEPRRPAASPATAADLDDAAVDADRQRAVAVGPEIEYVRASRRPPSEARRGLRRREERWSGCSARPPRCSTASPAARSSAPATSRRSTTSPTTGRGATPCSTADFVVTDKGTGLVHTAIAFGEEDFRAGRAVRDHASEPGARGRHLRRAHHRLRGPSSSRTPTRTIVEELQRARPAAARRALRALLSALLALRHAAPLLREVELVHRAPPRSATACSRENERIDWHPEHIKHGRFGNWLEGNVDWALSRDRYWGTPLPIWECESEDCERALLRRVARRAARARRRGPRGPPPPLHRRGQRCAARLRRRDAPRPGDDRHLVRLGLDAVRAVPLPVRGRGEFDRAVPGRLHLRGDRPDPRLVLHAARRVDADLRPHQLPQLRLPRA